MAQMSNIITATPKAFKGYCNIAHKETLGLQYIEAMCRQPLKTFTSNEAFCLQFVYHLLQNHYGLKPALNALFHLTWRHLEEALTNATNDYPLGFNLRIHYKETRHVLHTYWLPCSAESFIKRWSKKRPKDGRGSFNAYVFATQDEEKRDIAINHKMAMLHRTAFKAFCTTSNAQIKKGSISLIS